MLGRYKSTSLGLRLFIHKRESFFVKGNVLLIFYMIWRCFTSKISMEKNFKFSANEKGELWSNLLSRKSVDLFVYHLTFFV